MNGTYEFSIDNLGHEGPTAILPVYDVAGASVAWMTGQAGHYVPLTGNRGCATLCFYGPVPTEAQIREKAPHVDGYDMFVSVPFVTTDVPGVCRWGLFVLAYPVQ